MVDVISLQTNEQDNMQITGEHDSILINHFYNNSKPPPLQNRQLYPFHGIHDDANNFYAGKGYQVSHSNKKRTLESNEITTNNNNNNKKQKTIITPSNNSMNLKKTSYPFTSKPYDLFDNLMYY